MASNLEIKSGKESTKTLASIFGKKNGESAPINTYSSYNRPINRDSAYSRPYEKRPLDENQIEKRHVDKKPFAQNPSDTYFRNDSKPTPSYEIPQTRMSPKKVIHSAWEKPLLISAQHENIDWTSNSEESNVITSAKNETRQPDLVSQPERKITRSTKYNKNSLVARVRILRDQITENGRKSLESYTYPEDKILMTKFQHTFSEKYDQWGSLINFILEQVNELDKNYLADNYFGFTEKILGHIANIGLSYLIIGCDMTSGSGIDNFTRPNMTNDIKQICQEKLSVRQQIALYFQLLPKKMELIAKEFPKFAPIKAKHLKYLQKSSDCTASIQTLRDTIAKQKKDISKQKDEETLKLMKENLANNQDALEKIIVQQKGFDEKIKTKILEMKNIENVVHREFSVLENTLQFNYFMHDDWCSPLDSSSSLD